MELKNTVLTWGFPQLLRHIYDKPGGMLSTRVSFQDGESANSWNPSSLVIDNVKKRFIDCAGESSHKGHAYVSIRELKAALD